MGLVSQEPDKQSTINTEECLPNVADIIGL